MRKTFGELKDGDIFWAWFRGEYQEFRKNDSWGTLKSNEAWCFSNNAIVWVG